MSKYIFMDIKRAVISWKFLLSIIGIAVTFYLFGREPIRSSALISTYQLNIYQVQILLIYVISIIPYSDALCQDIEQRFYQPLIIRGGITSYSVAKSVGIFVSSMLTMIFGTELYVLILKIRYPQAIWIINDEVQGAFAGVIERGMYPAYIFLCSVQLGLLVGILGMFCALISLYILNRLLALSLPIIIYYIMSYVSGIVSPKYNFGMIYDPWYTVNENEFFSFLITIGVTAVLFVILQGLIRRKVRGRLCNG